MLAAVAGTTFGQNDLSTSPLDRLRERSARERFEARKALLERSRTSANEAVRITDPETPAPRASSSGRVIEDPFRAAPIPRPAPQRTIRTNAEERPIDAVIAPAVETIEITGSERSPMRRIERTPEQPLSVFATQPAPVVGRQPVVDQPPVVESTPEPTPAGEPLPAPMPEPGGPTTDTPAVAPGEAEAEPYGQRLLRIGEIEPFFDYEPDPRVRTDEPCRHLCPRPDGAPCKPFGPGSQACPDEFEMPVVDTQLRPMTDTVYTWEASNLWHNPLYFDDPALERYGHTHNFFVQPFVSVGRFGAQLVHLPYKATIDPYHRKMYTLGWYRPGDMVPKQVEVPGWNRDAAVMQGLWTTGAVFVIP